MTRLSIRVFKTPFGHKFVTQVFLYETQIQPPSFQVRLLTSRAPSFVARMPCLGPDMDRSAEPDVCSAEEEQRWQYTDRNHRRSRGSRGDRIDGDGGNRWCCRCQWNRRSRRHGWYQWIQRDRWHARWICRGDGRSGWDGIRRRERGDGCSRGNRRSGGNRGNRERWRSRLGDFRGG